MLVAESVGVAVDVDQRVLHEFGRIERRARPAGAGEQELDPGGEVGCGELVERGEGGLLALVAE
jgi:hypothetical protein